MRRAAEESEAAGNEEEEGGLMGETQEERNITLYECPQYVTRKLSFNLCMFLSLNQVEVRTLEMAPEGSVLLEVSDVSSRSLRARWTAPPRPNGNLIYTLHYKSKGSTELLTHSQNNTLHTCLELILHLISFFDPSLYHIIKECDHVGFSHVAQ